MFFPTWHKNPPPTILYLVFHKILYNLTNAKKTSSSCKSKITGNRKNEQHFTFLLKQTHFLHISQTKTGLSMITSPKSLVAVTTSLLLFPKNEKRTCANTQHILNITSRLHSPEQKHIASEKCSITNDRTLNRLNFPTLQQTIINCVVSLIFKSTSILVENI